MHTTLDVTAIIFDLDGVLVDSRAAVDQTWLEWCGKHGVDRDVVRRVISGMRTHDAVRRFAPDADADAEAAAIAARENELVDRCTAVPGARELLESLPPLRWGIATSGTDEIARTRLARTGLPLPDVFITAEMVTHGKPHPEVYERAARALGADPKTCVVFEDAPSGVAAAAGAGSLVIGVLTWADWEMLQTAYAVSDLRGVRAESHGPLIRLTIDDRVFRG